MTRALTILFLALLAAVTYFRLSTPAEVELPSRPAPPPEQPGKASFATLVSRSLSDGLPIDGEWRGKPSMSDLDGDGHLDMAVSIRRYDKFRIADGIHVYLGDGKGGWTAADTGLPDDMGYGGTALGDLNGDGRDDLFYSGHDLPPRAFLNFLRQEQADEWVALDSLIDFAGISCSDVALGDFTGDGLVDAAVMGFFPKTGGFYVMKNVDGAFEKKVQLLKKTHYGAIVRFRDVDGDDKLDLIGATSLGPKVWRFVDDEWVETAKGLPATFGLGEISGINRGIDAIDLDGDGKAELAASGLPANAHRSISLFTCKDGDEWSPWGEPLAIQESCFDVVFARLADGATGMFLAGQHGVLIVHTHATGRCEVLGRIENTADVLNVGAGDVDADGDDEVLVLGQRGVRVFDFDLPSIPSEETR